MPLPRPFFLSVTVLVASIAGHPAGAAAPWGFEGRWDCGIGIFSFTSISYDPGDGVMEILDVAEEGDSWILTFEDDYQLSLQLHGDGSLGWFSPVSGDGFECRPVK